MTARSDFFSSWRGLDEWMKFIDKAVANSEGVATIEEAGKSFEGRSIKAVRITGPGYVSGKPKVVMTCMLHAREWLPGMTCLYALQEFIAKSKADPTWLTDTEIVMIPMVNPDGYQYSVTTNRFWRKNRRTNPSWRCDGVDLNRNWPPTWGGRQGTSNSPCSDVFYGTGAATEPESQAVKKILDETPISVYLDIHSFSEVILRPWGFTTVPHAHQDKIDELGLAMVKAIKGVNGLTYQYGGAELLYPADGTAMDYGTLVGGYGFTYEVRPASGGMNGFAPGADQIKPCSEETLQGYLTAIKWAQNNEPLAADPPAPPPPPSCRRRWYCF